MMYPSKEHGLSNNNMSEIYDIPKPATPVNYDLPKNMRRVANSGNHAIMSQRYHDMLIKSVIQRSDEAIQEEDESYDIPRPLYASQIKQQCTLTPSSSNSSLLTSESINLSFSSSNRSSLASNMADYDVPRRNPQPVHRQALQQFHQQQQQQHMLNNKTTTTTTTSNLGSEGLNFKLLPLELTAALEALAKLHNEITNVISRLLHFVGPNWRQPEKLELHLMEVNLVAVRLRTALQALTEFGEGAFANAQRSEDCKLAKKLRPLVRSLRDANKLICDTCNAIECQGGWTLKNLARNYNERKSQAPDCLDQLIACAQTLTEDVRQITSFIQGNACLLFKRQAALATSARAQQSSDWLEDYDYVSFESKDMVNKKHNLLRDEIIPGLKHKFDSALKLAEHAAISGNMDVTTTTTAPHIIRNKQQQQQNSDFLHKDILLLRYYASQISTYLCNLQQAIDAFLEAVERNQPPKFFIAYGKFVVISAHNLVSIGDIIHRSISKLDLRDKIIRCTNALTEALRTCVNKTTNAAAHFPSVTAVQEMVDSVVSISHLANELKIIMLQAVQVTLKNT